MILVLRTETKGAYVGLFNGNAEVSKYEWLADRQLAKDLLRVIRDELKKASISWNDLTGVVVFKGPGSFTGLRIGITVANTLAYSLDIPVVGTNGDDEWLALGLDRLEKKENDRIVLPFYGAEAHITAPRK
ncbi:MAG TPA: tRNA (adenosine(37)-N6)-threonylcarbamoyltransferase complex dimerization subunit type 1 TsaB [Candidatus Saccharimonadales bacterium]|nr:tRNA (adenosine(37)-N6)-threonylcarbamoyltransferase complex dimerization subunit type 1 TsaB [Candidatus Saccharimonadales bacterium]